MPPKIRCTSQQKKILCKYMSSHRLFANGEYNGPLGAARHEAQWTNLAEELRNYGPNKSVLAWKVTWRDITRKSRHNNAAANRARRRTGNMVEVPAVSEDDQLVLAAIGRASSETGIGDDILQQLVRNSRLYENATRFWQTGKQYLLDDMKILEEH